MTEAILAVDRWPSNAALMEACRTLGYLGDGRRTLDATFGLGNFWTLWRPDGLVALDRYVVTPPERRPVDLVADFTRLPFADRTFEDAVFDGPYKLNGTPSDTDGADTRYGVGGPVYTRWQDRMTLLRQGLQSCAWVTSRTLLVKCQDQVCSGRMRWQTTYLVEAAEAVGFGLVDRFDFLSYRAQPEGRRQVTARHNASQLLVFRRGHSWRP